LGLTSNIVVDPSAVWVPLTVLAASLAGSAHCVGMCGSLVTAAAPNRRSWAAYQIGRLCSYVALGAIAGGVGGRLLGASSQRWLGWSAAIAMGIAFGILGIKAWKGNPAHFKLIPQKWIEGLYRKSRGAPFLLGACSAILPCGWLHTFTLAAGATQNPLSGGLLMAVFWCGTLPALSAAPWVVRRILQPLQRKSPRIAALLLIGAGIAGIGLKVQALAADPGRPHCHCEDAAHEP
jgi:uncharacterized protein